MKADLSALDRKYRARRTAQSPAEYAAAIHCYRAPTSWTTHALRLAAFAILAATVLVLP